MSDELKMVALRIRDVREIHDLTLEEAAEKVGVDAATYRLYESGTVDIPVGFLYQLTRVFGVDLTVLLTGDEPRTKAYFVVRKGKGISVDRRKDYGYEALAYGFQHKMMEPFMVTVDKKDTEANKYCHEGQEFVHVVEGTLRVAFERYDVTLHEGDSIYFAASLPHGMNAVGGRTRFMSIITNHAAPQEDFPQ